MSRNITLSRGYVALVDDDDYESISKTKWYANFKGRGNYPYAYRKKYINHQYVNIAMHRQIMNAPKGVEVDHINGNPLDNRKSNLRLCTHGENMLNVKRKTNNKSGYTGVAFEKETNTWRAYINVKKKLIRLGRFKTIEEAVSCRKNAVKEFYGEFSPS